MLYLLLPCALAADAEGEFFGGAVVGYGRSWSPEYVDDRQGAATFGMAFSFFLPPVFYMPTSMQLMVLKLPGGSVFFPDVSVGYGLAPFGRWGPHAAGILGVGARLTGVEGNLGWSVGLGLGPVSIDYRARSGWQSYEPDRFLSRTIELSVLFDFDELD